MASLWVCAACVFLSALFNPARCPALVFGVIGLWSFCHRAGPQPGPRPQLTAACGPITIGLDDGRRVLVDSGDPRDGLADDARQFRAARREPAFAADRRQRHASSPRIPCAVAADGRCGRWPTSLRPIARQLGRRTRSRPSGGLHLTLVAVFAVTEDLAVLATRPAAHDVIAPGAGLLALFGPGGGRGAAYVLVQMAILVIVAGFFQPSAPEFRWLVAICAYTCSSPACLRSPCGPSRRRD